MTHLKSIVVESSHGQLQLEIGFVLTKPTMELIGWTHHPDNLIGTYILEIFIDDSGQFIRLRVSSSPPETIVIPMHRIVCAKFRFAS